MFTKKPKLPFSVCQPIPELSEIYHGTLREVGVHYGVFEITSLGYYLYVMSELYDTHEYESGLRSRYGEYPVFLGKTYAEAEDWIRQKETVVLAN